MANFLTYNNASMKIITPFTQRGTIYGVLNNVWVSKKNETDVPANPDKPDISDNPNTPTNPSDVDNREETGEDIF